MRMWIKNARQIVRIVADDSELNAVGCLAGSKQSDCNLAILEQRDGGVGLSIIIDQYVIYTRKKEKKIQFHHVILVTWYI